MTKTLSREILVHKWQWCDRGGMLEVKLIQHWTGFASKISVSLFRFSALFDRLTFMHTHVSTLDQASTHTRTHTHLDLEILRPSCPSFHTVSRQGKNLGHHLSSLNLSITVTLDQWCRTHPSSPAGPCWTRLAQPGSSYHCQGSQLTACCCCSWFQFVGPAMSPCHQSEQQRRRRVGGRWVRGRALKAGHDGVTHVRIWTPHKHCRMCAAAAPCQRSNPRFGRENARVLQFTWWSGTCEGLNSSSRPDVSPVLRLRLSKRSFHSSLPLSRRTTCVNSIVMAAVSWEFWNFQTNHNGQ